MINSLVNHPRTSLHTWTTAQQAREKESGSVSHSVMFAFLQPRRL